MIGFVLSIVLTLAAYFLVDKQLLKGLTLEIAISVIALIQVFCQLVFFLHLGEEPKPRWQLHLFFFMMGVIVIIVGGTLWIMHNLDYNTMPMMPH